MTITVLKNKIPYPILNDFERCTAWLKMHFGVDVNFFVRETAIPVEYDAVSVYNKGGTFVPVWGIKNVESICAPSAPQAGMRVVLFLHDITGRTDPFVSVTHFTNGVGTIECATTKEWEGNDDIYRVFTHEFLHYCHKLLASKGIKTLDTLDIYDGEFDVENGANRKRNLAEILPHVGVLKAVWSASTPVLPPQPAPAPVSSGFLATLLAKLKSLQEELSRRKYVPPIKTPSGLTEIVRIFGDQTDPNFERNNIVSLLLPYPLIYQGSQVLSIRCHKLVRDQLAWCFSEIKRRGLQHLVQEYGGSFVQRPIRGGTVASTHSWGIAVDLEPTKYPLGSTKRFDPEVVEIFKTAGFENGADFPVRKDPMHMQYASNY